MTPSPARDIQDRLNQIFNMQAEVITRRPIKRLAWYDRILLFFWRLRIL